jgi:hypothetical protein
MDKHFGGDGLFLYAKFCHSRSTVRYLMIANTREEGIWRLLDCRVWISDSDDTESAKEFNETIAIRRGSFPEFTINS